MADFTLIYDGPAMQDGRMPVRELAPPLVALGDIFHEAHALTDPDSPPVDLEIRATDRSSFDVGLHLATSDIVTILSSPEAIAVGTLIGIVSGFFGLVKVLRGRRVDPRVEISGNTITLHVDQSTHITLPAAAKDLYDSPTARDNAERVVSPLRRDGVDIVRIVTDQTEPVEVTKDDLAAFETTPSPEAEDEATETPFEEMPLVTVQPALEGEARRRFKSGDTWITATMMDKGFLERVHERQEAFRAGDVLIARVLMRVWPPKPGQLPKLEWIVLKVHRHEQTGGQKVSLPFPEEE